MLYAVTYKLVLDVDADPADIEATREALTDAGHEYFATTKGVEPIEFDPIS